jgi:hypothetical protein
VVTTWEASRRWVPGWSGSLPCRATCRRPDRTIQGLLLIESTTSWRLAGSPPSIVQADRLARVLGTTLSELFAEVLSSP